MNFKVTMQTGEAGVEDDFGYDFVKQCAIGQRCVKRPVVHVYFELAKKMTFHTETGVQEGLPGMIAIVGADHAWPVTKEYFAAHYDVIMEGSAQC